MIIIIMAIIIIIAIKKMIPETLDLVTQRPKDLTRRRKTNELHGN